MIDRRSDPALTRRHLLKGAAALAALLPIGGMLSACGSDTGDTAADAAPEGSAEAAGSLSSGESAGAASGSSSSGESTGAASGSVLVAYFSATGNTEGIAQAIADHLGADVFAIQSAEPYTDEDLNYNDDDSRTSRERAEDASPELSQVVPDGFDGYDTVLLGYPIWWGSAAWPLKTFVQGNDFTGKTVVPFCTSASSPISRSGESLAELAGTGDWIEGERFAVGTDDEAVSWVDGLGL